MSSDPKEILRISIVEGDLRKRTLDLQPLMDAGQVKILDILDHPDCDFESEAVVQLFIHIGRTRASFTEQACRKIFASGEVVEAISWSDYLNAQIRDRQEPIPGNAFATLLVNGEIANPSDGIHDAIKASRIEVPLVDRLAQRDKLFTHSAMEIRIHADAPDDLASIIDELRGSLPKIDGVVDVAVGEWPRHRGSRHEHYRLIAFDMDSTLIEQEVIDELGREQDRYDEVAAITAGALRGEIDFRESLHRRVGLLEGMPVERLAEIAGRVTLTPGAERLVAALKVLGYKTAIISGGFNFVGRQIQERLGIDHLRAHTLGEADGKLTGEVVGAVIDGAAKEVLLREICAQEGIELDRTIAIGDGANDLPMLKAAGMGIAFHAKPVVREAASFTISGHGLDATLYFLGLYDDDIDAITNRLAD